MSEEVELSIQRNDSLQNETSGRETNDPGNGKAKNDHNNQSG